MNIRFDDNLKSVIQSPVENSRFVIKGPTGSGKTTVLMERYRYLVEELKVPSETILVLVLNRFQSMNWTKKCMPQNSGAVWRMSYQAFIRDELTTFYPLVLKSCPEIRDKHIKPVFMNFDCTRFLLAKVIESRRKTRGIFSSVASNDNKIASDIAFILGKASTSGVAAADIGARLYDCTDVKDEERKLLYKETDEFIKDYRKKCFELGIFDLAMSVEIYNKYLLNNEQYMDLLKTRVQHILVDNTEECTEVEMALIDFLMPHVKTCMLGYNCEGGIGECYEKKQGKIVDKIIKKCRVFEMKQSHTCSSFMYEFSDMLYDGIHNSTVNTAKEGTEIERQPATGLRSEMLEKVGARVCNLVNNEGFKPSDIIILSTYADPVTEAVIGGILMEKGIKLKNLSGKSRIIDNVCSQALVTLAILCHKQYRIVPRMEDVKEFIRTIFDTDPVRASALACSVYKNINSDGVFPVEDEEKLSDFLDTDTINKYCYVRKWAQDYISRDNPLPIHEFFHRAFLELVITPNMSYEDISSARKLVEAAESFGGVVTRFGMNGDRHFLETVYKGLEVSEGIFGLEESMEGEYVLLTNPYTFLTGSLTGRVVILTSISSTNWYPRTVKEIINPHVLLRSWDTSDTYTEEIEEANRTHYLGLVMRGIVKRCGEKLITFESDTSANGFENSGLLSEYLHQAAGGGK